MRDSAECGCTLAPAPTCSLETEEFRNRLILIRSLAARALRSRQRDGLRLFLGYDVNAAAQVRELVEMERLCCAFLDFQLAEQGERLLLTITAPANAIDTAEAIFSEFNH